MENFILYMAKVSGLIALFYLAYYALLRKETFFSSNRWFLLAGLVTSVALPLLVFTKTVWVEPAPVIQLCADPATLSALQSFTPPPPPPAFEINWLNVTAIVYLAGALLFAVRLVLDIYKVVRMLKGHAIIKESNFKLIDSTRVQAPFSFFNYIAYNSALLTPQELENIIEHEKVHSRQKHSADMLLGQLACVIFWFNPFVWMYKKMISQNLEFIADAEALKQIADSKHYQKTLLKITVQPDCLAVTNHFYQSLIKKRIVMLNKEQSKKRNILKYTLIIPALTAFFFLFQIKTVAQEKGMPIALMSSSSIQEQPVCSDTPPELVIMEVHKDVTSTKFEESIALFKQLFDADVTYKNITRNSKNEITSITVAVKDKDNQTSYPVYESVSDDNTPIKAFIVGIEKIDSTNKNRIFFDEVKKYSVTEDKVAKPSTTPQTAEEYIENSNKGRNRLTIVNGVKQKDGILYLPVGHRIHKMTELDPKSAKKKYGKEGKNGAIELTTLPNEGNPYTIVINDTFKELSKVNFSENVFDNMPNVKHLTVTTTITEGNEAATSTVGTLTIQQQDNSLYMVHSESHNRDLGAAKAGLKKIGIDMQYSEITRNEEGALTGVKIELTDMRNGAKASAAWEESRNPDGIPNIFIGRKKGELTVSSSN